jgi:hypothetical protein
VSPYLQRWKFDSFGAAEILKWLVDGDMFDAGRLPGVTLLLALGVAMAVLSRARPARVALALFVVWLLLYFGRATWGHFTSVLPLHAGLLLHRFVGSVHLAATLLIGLGGEWLWLQLRPVPDRWRALVLTLIVLTLLTPALMERRTHYALNTEMIQRTRQALEGDADARTMLATLAGLPPGRTYVGLRANWGKEMRFGEVHFYDLLTFHRIPAVSPPYSDMSLNADILWHFDDGNPAHYDVFNVRYVVAPRSWRPPGFLRRLKQTPRYVLYEAPTHGYGELITIGERVSPASQTALFFNSRNWFLGAEPAARKFVRYDFPPGTGSVSSDGQAASERVACPAGTVADERVEPGRIDLRVECPTASTVVLKVTYHPNWKVTVDGRPVPTFMVSPSLIGVDLPPGVHRVSAEYRSGFLKTALLILGVFTLLSVVAFRRSFANLEQLLSPARRAAPEPVI